ncbi:hypothetical protein [Streptomyces sp. NPDC001388]|uniref:hypothetical protein n=1 Tax=Streptomyces sp. NPDC001388 TaxID=3364568 RepID=UPI003677AB7E
MSGSRRRWNSTVTWRSCSDSRAFSIATPAALARAVTTASSLSVNALLLALSARYRVPYTVLRTRVCTPQQGARRRMT